MVATGMMSAVIAQAGKAVTAKKMEEKKRNPSPFKKVSTKARKVKKSKMKKAKTPPYGKTSKGRHSLY